MTRQEEPLLPRSITDTDDLGRRAARIAEIDQKHRERLAPLIEAKNAEEAAKKRARQGAAAPAYEPNPEATDPDSTDTEENR